MRLEDLPPRYQAQAARQMTLSPEKSSVHKTPNLIVLSQASRAQRKLTKTEELFATEWPPQDRSGVILAQCLVLPFADGTSYRPDFIRIDSDGIIHVYEVKGGHVGKVAWSRIGIERFRRATEAFPMIRMELWVFNLGTWVKKFPIVGKTTSRKFQSMENLNAERSGASSRPAGAAGSAMGDNL